MGMAGLAVYIQTKALLSYAEDVIPPPEVIERMAQSKGSVVSKKETKDDVKKNSDCSECLKKPQPPEWMKEDD